MMNYSKYEERKKKEGGGGKEFVGCEEKKLVQSAEVSQIGRAHV